MKIDRGAEEKLTPPVVMEAEDEGGLGQGVSAEVMNWAGFWIHCGSTANRAADIGGDEESGMDDIFS